LGEEDSTFAFLPELQASFFSNGNFFFVGGAPFIEQHIEYDTATNQQIIFKDANQKSEQRFRIHDTENRYHILKSIMHYKKPKVSIDFGGPVYMSDLPADDVRGIGSVKHNFGKEVPVFFLMDSGVAQGHLKYFREPFTTQYPCYSDDTHLIFSCSPDIDVEQIIGIYIPYSDNGLTTCAISRPDRWSWTADLNNDTIPDIACVIDINNGPESGVMEMLWFANVNGTWKIIDYGLMPFCS
jgi:hypothetical protein